MPDIPSKPLPLSMLYSAPQALVRVIMPVALDTRQKTLLDQALAALPAEKQVAFTAVATNAGVEMVVAVRAGQHWEVAGRLMRPKGGKLEYGAEVSFSWP